MVNVENQVSSCLFSCAVRHNLKYLITKRLLKGVESFYYYYYLQDVYMKALLHLWPTAMNLIVMQVGSRAPGGGVHCQNHGWFWGCKWDTYLEIQFWGLPRKTKAILMGRCRNTHWFSYIHLKFTMNQSYWALTCKWMSGRTPSVEVIMPRINQNISGPDYVYKEEHLNMKSVSLTQAQSL